MAFQKGNIFGRGRPKISLQKPELLLPAVFGKAGINWQNDFIKLYRLVRTDGYELTASQSRLLKFFSEYMPYLCTKVALKELDNAKATTVENSVAQAKASQKLLQALEAENSGPSSQSQSSGS